MFDTITINAARPVPVFPLQDCILFPHTMLPLHIFEPRYREMVSDALDASGLIAMALFAEKVGAMEYLQGRPALRPFLCLGYIRTYEHLADGRYLIILQGLCRARLSTEVDHTPYRMARVQPVDTGGAGEEGLQPFRERIDRLLQDSRLFGVEAVQELHKQISGDLSTKALVDIAAAALFRGTDNRYAMLSETSTHKRADKLIRELERLLHGVT
jgi:Lon protease-like protein